MEDQASQQVRYTYKRAIYLSQNFLNLKSSRYVRWW